MKHSRESDPEDASGPPAKSPPKWPIYALLAVAVVVPAFFWRGVWFGSHLSDAEIRRRLAPPQKLRDVQHVCERISQRMARDPAGARQFYDLLVPLADHPNEEIRSVVAWCMGEDGSRYPPFHEALGRLVNDHAPRVRHNAALGLVRLGDPAARDVLREMLTPYAVAAQWKGPAASGTVVDILAEKDPVSPLMQIALVDTGEDEHASVLAPLGGRLGEVAVGLGDRIAKGETVCTIEPSFARIEAALRALVLVGEMEDSEYIHPYRDPDSRFSHSQRTRIRTQAELAVDAIRSRGERKEPHPSSGEESTGTRVH